MKIFWRNSEVRYGLVAMLLHWLIALAIIGMLGLGLYMAEFARKGSLAQFELYQLHKSIGITILLLSIFRLGWRLANPVPAYPDSLRPWQKRLAKFSHLGFYALMIAMPLSGWAMVSASPLNIPTFLFEAVPWPHLPVLSVLENREKAEAMFKILHKILASGIFFLLLLHVTAAFWHQYGLRDNLLRRMLPPEKAVDA